MTNIVELEHKIKSANAKVYALEGERNKLLNRIAALEAEVLELKTPWQIAKEKKIAAPRDGTLKATAPTAPEPDPYLQGLAERDPAVNKKFLGTSNVIPE